MAWIEIQCRIDGTSPLLLHKFPDVPAPAGHEKKPAQDQAEYLVWRGKKKGANPGDLVFPAFNLSRSFAGGGKHVKSKGRATCYGLFPGVVEGDWYFHIDADERVVGCLPVPEDGQHYALQIFTRELHNTWVPRLWQHRGWMRYEGSHNALWSDDRLIHMKGSVRVDPSDCRFLHLSHLRHEDRQRDKGKYYAWKRPAEMGYRRAHQI